MGGWRQLAEMERPLEAGSLGGGLQGEGRS